MYADFTISLWNRYTVFDTQKKLYYYILTIQLKLLFIFLKRKKKEKKTHIDLLHQTSSWETTQ